MDRRRALMGILYYDDCRKSCFSSKIFALVEDIAIFFSVAIEDCDMYYGVGFSGKCCPKSWDVARG